MTRDEYNKKVQAVQEVWPESACRIEQQTGQALFQVYFGRWRTLGIQRHPFQPHTEYEWDEEEEIKAMAHFAGGVTSDRISR